MASTLLLARTPTEAHIYMDLHPCECGESDFSRTGSVIEYEDDLASRYTGICPGCGELREFLFAIPQEVRLRPPGTVVFGDKTPSELLDPGEWLWVAERYASVAPARVAAGTEAARIALQQVATAAAAMDEVLKFIPAGQDMVPYEALRSKRGRAVYDEQPGRFYQDRLEVVRDAYREIVAEMEAAKP